MAEVARLDAILSADVTGFQKGMQVASESVIKLGNLQKSIGNLQPFSPFIAQSVKAAKSVEDLKDVLAQLKIEQASATNPVELKAYNEAIKSVTTEVKRLGSSESGISGIGKSLTGALSSVRQLAYILPGIGMAGIFNLAFEAISAAAEELHIFNAETTAATKYSADLGGELAKGNADLNTELVKLSALVQVARDHSASLQARKSAIGELQKEYPGYLSNINLENINSQEAANAIGLLTDALARKAKVQAYSNLLTKATEDLIKAQNSKLYDNVTVLDQALAALKGLGNVSVAATSLATSGFKNQAETVAGLQGVVDDLSHSLADLTQQQAASNDFVLLNPTKLKAAKAAIEELTPAIRKLSFDKFEKDIGVTTYDLGTQIQSALDKAPAIPLNVKVDVKPALTDAEKSAQKLIEAIKQIEEDVVAGIGEGIGNLISGKKNPFGSLFQILGEGIKALGKQLIVLGALGEAVQKALSALITNPVLAVAAGIALEALGTIVANKGVQLHAEGGIFTQPTQWGNHVIGEKGPEALVPLNRMNELGLAGGGRQVVVMETRISGSDLILIQNRAQTAAGRAYGSNFNRRN